MTPRTTHGLLPWKERMVLQTMQGAGSALQHASRMNGTHQMMSARYASYAGAAHYPKLCFHLFQSSTFKTIELGM